MPLETDAGRLDLARLVDAGGDQAPRRGALRSSSSVASRPTSKFSWNLMPPSASRLHAALNDIFLQLEIRDAVDQQPARAIVPVDRR